MTAHDDLGRNSLRILGLILRRPGITIQSMRRVTGIRGNNGIVFHLQKLRRLGLAEWEPIKKATIRATCRFIPEDQLP